MTEGATALVLCFNTHTEITPCPFAFPIARFYNTWAGCLQLCKGYQGDKHACFHYQLVVEIFGQETWHHSVTDSCSSSWTSHGTGKLHWQCFNRAVLIFRTMQRNTWDIWTHKSLEVVSGNYKSLLNREGNIDKITTTTVSGDIVRNILVKGIIKEGGEGQCVGLFSILRAIMSSGDTEDGSLFKQIQIFNGFSELAAWRIQSSELISLTQHILDTMHLDFLHA